MNTDVIKSKRLLQEMKITKGHDEEMSCDHDNSEDGVRFIYHYFHLAFTYNEMMTTRTLDVQLGQQSCVISSLVTSTHAWG